VYPPSSLVTDHHGKERGVSRGEALVQIIELIGAIENLQLARHRCIWQHAKQLTIKLPKEYAKLFRGKLAIAIC
jgi:hypothetical protein